MGPVIISMRPGVGQLVMRQWYWGLWWIFGGKFFWRGGGVILLGVLRKMGCRTWFFAGKFVVERW
jgi:hypothetical protein